MLEIGPFDVVEDFPGALGADHDDGGDVWVGWDWKGEWEVGGKISEVGYGQAHLKDGMTIKDKRYGPVRGTWWLHCTGSVLVLVLQADVRETGRDVPTEAALPCQ